MVTPARPALALLASSMSLAGCGDTAGAGGFGPLVTLAALAAAAGGFYGFGLWRERARTQAELHRLRREARQWRVLVPQHSWRSDAEHRLLEWQPPVAIPSSPSAQAPAPPPDAQALAAALAARQPLRGRPVPAAGDDTLQWVLDAQPLEGDDGSFAGFVGSARACDGVDDPLRLAELIDPLLACAAGAALVARQRNGGWAVERHNPQARSLWADIEAGFDLERLLAALPAVLAERLRSLAAGQSAELDGWRLVRLGPLPGGDMLLLARLAPDEPAAAADAEAFGPTLSHDLRAPIRVVEGFTKIVKEDYGRLLDRVGNEHLDRVLGAAARMNLMIDALLTLARLSSQPLARQPVNLSQLASYVADDLRRSAPEREVEIEIEPGLAATGDPTLLRTVLDNLLGNAWKYTSRTPRARIALRRSVQGSRTCYQVIDNGAGFDMRSAERLFSLFQRLHSQSEFPGHGIGLASVRRIVQRHGGQIWAQAEPGRGATFSFTLG